MKRSDGDKGNKIIQIPEERSDGRIRNLVKAILPRGMRKSIFGLDKIEVDSLIEDFRNAKEPEEKVIAVRNIVNNQNLIPKEYSHFVKLANHMNETNKYMAKDMIVKPKSAKWGDSLGGPAKDAQELEDFMQNLKAGKTKSLISGDGRHLMMTSDMMKILINSIYEDFSREDYKRDVSAIEDIITANKNGANTSEQLSALEDLIINKYPLVMHLIAFKKHGKSVDHSNLLNYGSYFHEKDPQFVNRWEEHQELQANFKEVFKSFVESGMKNPDKFEKNMKLASNQVAEIFKQDLEMMPLDKLSKSKSKEEIIDKIENFQKEYNSEKLYLKETLKKAGTVSIDQAQKYEVGKEVPLDELPKQKVRNQVPLDEQQPSEKNTKSQNSKNDKQKPLDETQEHEKNKLVKKVSDERRSQKVKIGSQR
ncbi:hypothetical protein NF27_DT01730 [Candidatus Jidaibacter acanthamoeba]|uniref:Uncharacterized protein n=1 Tax=Candidatus Jidaibacter acanthamoebae TaxID=86105 RepID=A0A0C1QIQ1_9RICK|nr:hypothetical protein [Candidatus Jidaibacter acanthamoeba]KIE05399.1 hypothetical protein NF27_DT01730 [Candidatus Jidaibacter acanthamoeba]